MNIQQAKDIDIVDFLAGLNFTAIRVRENNYWYFSPVHDEKNPSFKINRRLNRWYDFSIGQGGNLVDFGIRYYKCPVKDFLQMLAGNFSLVRPYVPTGDITQKSGKEERQISIISINEVKSYPLRNYLRLRGITSTVSNLYLKEIHYQIGNKTYYALGFANDAGGYELRNQFVKLSSSPKAITFIQNGADELVVFEGFFNFLSYQNMYYKEDGAPCNFLVLNSSAFFEKSLPLMQSHKCVHLYLDNDKTGDNCTQKALSIDPVKFTDHRSLYHSFNDLNERMTQTDKKRLRQKH